MYLPKHEVERLSRQHTLPALGGETRVLTIFFSDIEGFASISENMEPKTLVLALNRYLTLMTAAIEEQGGIVDKYVGDSIIAFFGAPVSHFDDHLRAIRAARTCNTSVLVDSELKTLLPGVKLKTRIGINTGKVLVGNLGSKHRMNYTVMGDEVNLASRLEGANKVFGTNLLISEGSIPDSSVQSDLRKVGTLRVKGRLKPVAVYTLEGHLKRQEVLDFESALTDLVIKPEDALGVFSALADRDPVSRFYFDLMTHKKPLTGRLAGDVIELFEK
jgi:adenylate cyclase/guanylate cyclase